MNSNGAPSTASPNVGRRPMPPIGDDNRGAVIEYNTGLWRSQDGALMPRDRQIEDNVRMLCGQQWNVFVPLLQKSFDVTEWMTDAEKRWRQRPVINYLLQWYIMTHARLTESQPIVTFVPGPDRQDADLAEAMDVVFKVSWRNANMTDVVDRLMTWVIAGGTGYLLSRIDMGRGPWRQWVGAAEVPLVDAYGAPLVGPDGAPQTLFVPNGVPFDKTGKPLAVITPDGLQITGHPHAEREGEIVVDVPSPLEVRGEWGPTPWHQKRWHAMRGFYTPEQVFERWGVEVQPDTSLDDANLAILDRMLFGAGYFGAASGRFTLGGAQTSAKLQLVEVQQTWHAPRSDVAGMEESPTNPGGRYTANTATTLLYDGPRKVAYPYTSPIRRFEFVRVPGRPGGTTPLEAMIGPQRSYNKLRAQVAEHANLCSNPKYVVDAQSGIEDGQWNNEPGTGLKVNRRNGVPPVEWISPPRLGEDVYRALNMAREEILDIGSLKGTQGEPLSPDQSGEAIKELRFNSDRFVGPTARRSVEEFGRMVEDWMALAPVIFDTERILSYAGEDNIAKTVTILPEMFANGKVNVIPDVESMLPEGRGERQQKITSLYQMGVFGVPGSPEAVRQYLELARFPNVSRTAKPGGVDRSMAEQENAKLMLGVPAAQIPVLPWYNHLIHIEVIESVMKGPEFLKLPPEVQGNFEVHRLMHLEAAMTQMPQIVPPVADPGIPGVQPSPDAVTTSPKQQSHPTPAPAAPPNGGQPPVPSGAYQNV